MLLLKSVRRYTKNLKLVTGFTLVELIVSIGVFTIVIFVGTSSLLNLLSVYRATEASRNVMDNLNFALESMARSLRVGVNYHCDITETNPILTAPRDCPSNGQQSIVFIDIQKGAILTAYRLNGTTIERSRNCGPFSCANWEPIVAPEVVVNDMRFYVDGAQFSVSDPEEDIIQPRILITIAGEAGIREKEKIPFTVQTLISQRILDR